MLAGIHELLQQLNHLTGAAHFTSEKSGQENPVPGPRHYPRPHEVHTRGGDGDDEAENE